jgi:glycosyltransferase involved in cell wall biosynthesis
VTVKNASPVVTVIIPTYNLSGALKLALETVRRQTFADLEAWIIGDGCSDDSERVVAAFGEERFRWLNLPENSGGPSRPRNEGLARASGRYVAYLGHDDLWFPWHLEELLGHARRSGCAFVHSLGAIIGPEGACGLFSLPRSLALRHDWISPSNWLHELSLVRAVGPWSPKARVADDREFLGRLRARGIRIGHHPRLSVLKFPSDFWRMYSLSSAFPQETYAAAT